MKLESQDDRITLLIADVLVRAWGEQKHLPAELVAERLKVGFSGRPELDKAVGAMKELITAATKIEVPPDLELEEWRKRQS